MSMRTLALAALLGATALRAQDVQNTPLSSLPAGTRVRLQVLDPHPPRPDLRAVMEASGILARVTADSVVLLSARGREGSFARSDIVEVAVSEGVVRHRLLGAAFLALAGVAYYQLTHPSSQRQIERALNVAGLSVDILIGGALMSQSHEKWRTVATCAADSTDAASPCRN